MLPHLSSPGTRPRGANRWNHTKVTIRGPADGHTRLRRRRALCHGSAVCSAGDPTLPPPPNHHSLRTPVYSSSRATRVAFERTKAILTSQLWCSFRDDLLSEEGEGGGDWEAQAQLFCACVERAQHSDKGGASNARVESNSCKVSRGRQPKA